MKLNIKKRYVSVLLILISSNFLYSCKFINFCRPLYRCSSMSEGVVYKPGKLTEDFVRGVLKDHCFNALAVQNISILLAPHQGFSCLGHIIYIPFDDEQLLQAQQLKRDATHKVDVNLPQESIFFYDHMNGAVITSESLDLWKGLLIHEMSHVVHNDTLCRVGLLIAHGWAGLYMMYPPEKLSRLFKTAFLTLVSQQTLGLMLAYQQECRADQEIIDRIKDPAIAYALYRFYDRYDSYVKEHQNDGLISFDEHPAPFRRAERFRKAYERMREVNS